MMSQLLIIIAALYGAVAVALGAFAAHGLKSRLSEQLLTVFQTGVTYQFYHTLALLLAGLWLRFAPSPWVAAAGIFWALGVVLFSGSLYALALTSIKWFGPITPLGGLLFILGWICLLVGAVKA
ncbi:MULTISPECIES: DUF423 domain-containing protein [Idiomarina]|jgi:uncharacterized membrane protein YgdD (TMEM256/DUF423 family)|uniref:Uncharacterized conserved membrane protein n=2 Tax=Idiomarina TaxID=135575 RepID=A0ABM9WMG9_9GAMM|nr:Uncharacterized conserved membrane protein [Idiomarina baltica OS145]|tara:strand:+ start:249 stop:620 length:372 start_codon:yes stop_codon:yes gene_type:complete